MTTERRFLAKVAPMMDDRGCWEWTGYRNPKGYGVFRSSVESGGSLNLAHRYAYALYKGAIPPGLTLDHLCRNRSCVKPGHLEPVTQHENILRGNSPPAVCAKKTQCPKGHPYDMKDNGRRCRACRQAGPRASYHALKAKRRCA